MMMARLMGAAILVAGIGIGGIVGAQAQERSTVTIGTGGQSSVYYPTGGAICRLLNAERDKTGILCAVQPSGGSVDNVRALVEGSRPFGIVQSDVLADAVAGKGAFAGQPPATQLRAVFSVYVEPVQLMVRADAGIATLADLAGKKVNLGAEGSGTRSLAELTLGTEGIDPASFAASLELAPDDQAQALCSGAADASFFVAGVPSGTVQAATASCNIRLLPLAGPKIDAMLAAHHVYLPSVIPGGIYLGNPRDIASWGPKAVLVTTDAVPAATVQALVAAVFDNFQEFRQLHPAFAALTPVAMTTQGLSAPLQAGAETYYKQKGWR